jgi:hypothetical protein
MRLDIKVQELPKNFYIPSLAEYVTEKDDEGEESQVVNAEISAYLELTKVALMAQAKIKDKMIQISMGEVEDLGDNRNISIQQNTVNLSVLIASVTGWGNIYDGKDPLKYDGTRETIIKVLQRLKHNNEADYQDLLEAAGV